MMAIFQSKWSWRISNFYVTENNRQFAKWAAGGKLQQKVCLRQKKSACCLVNVLCAVGILFFRFAKFHLLTICCHGVPLGTSFPSLLYILIVYRVALWLTVATDRTKIHVQRFVLYSYTREHNQKPHAVQIRTRVFEGGFSSSNFFPSAVIYRRYWWNLVVSSITYLRAMYKLVS